MSVCNRDFLLCDNDVMEKQRIKEECDCVKKSVCFEIVRLLKNWHRPEATELLEKI
jgi:hypothetical protein